MSQSPILERRAAAATADEAGESRLPSALRLGFSRAGIELRQYFRQRDAVVFTFAYPVIMMLIFGSIFKGDVPNTHVPFTQYFTAGIAATGTMSVGFQGVADLDRELADPRHDRL